MPAIRRSWLPCIATRTDRQHGSLPTHLKDISMPIRNICVIGGSGFVGRHLVSRLAAGGFQVWVPTRNRERLKQDLILLPHVTLIDADVHDPATLATLLAEQDAVINLVGILHGSDADFERAHVELPGKIIAACRQQGVRRLLHMSALQADSQGPSRYLRSKGRGQALVQQSGLDFTVFQPSVIFGQGDSFLSLFARLASLAPVLPLAGADARFQPVWVGDVARCFVQALQLRDTIGQTYPLGGPRCYRLRELVDYAARLTGHPRPVLALSDTLASLQAALLEKLPGQLMSRDNLASMQVDSVCNGPFPAAFGFKPAALEAIAPQYLARQTPRGRFDHYRARNAG